MYIYDKAHELAREIKNCPEYAEYIRTKNEAFEDPTSADLIKQYKKLQFSAQAEMITGKQPDESTLDQLQKISDVLSFNSKVSAYFAAEYKFNTLISDIYKIIGSACDVDMSFMQE